jgi:kynureninase
MTAAATSTPRTREALAELDRRDPLAGCRDAFALPEGILYFDGNSLGPLTHASRRRVREVTERQWGRDLIGSWNVHDWIHLPLKVGDRIARLIGAAAGEVVVADSTSVNLFKLLAAALALRPERRTILSEASNFPTDLYMAQGLADLKGAGVRLRQVAPGDLTAAIDADVAVVTLSHVDFKTGELRDMAAVGRAARDQGALVVWDLAHSAGALAVDLGGSGAELAVGCGYKFFNGGPGAPAFVYVARRLQERARSPLYGWLGHREPFAFEACYAPAEGIGRFQCGTPPILALAALDAALDVFDGIDLADLRRKSVALGDLFLDLVEQECAGMGLEIACPRDGERRGSQVSLRHRRGYAVVQALIDRGVVGDFRVPDVLRFGLTPLYQRHVDVWDAVAILRQVFETRAFEDPRYDRRGAVT